MSTGNAAMATAVVLTPAPTPAQSATPASGTTDSGGDVVMADDCSTPLMDIPELDRPSVSTCKETVPFTINIGRESLVQLLADLLDAAFGSKQPVRLLFDDGRVHKSTFMFQSRTYPRMPIQAYFHRIAKYSQCSNETMLLAMLYIFRLMATHANFVINLMTLHRVLISAVRVASKFMDDGYMNNAWYAKVGGIPLKEINALEVEFLYLVGFHLHATVDEYNDIYARMITNNPFLAGVLRPTPPATATVSSSAPAPHPASTSPKLATTSTVRPLTPHPPTRTVSSITVTAPTPAPTTCAASAHKPCRTMSQPVRRIVVSS